MTTKLVSTGVEFPDATTQTTSGVPLTGGTMTGALTTTGFTSTGIDDNATSTAITIDSRENIGFGAVANTAWDSDSGLNAIQIGAYSSLWNYYNNVQLSMNAYQSATGDKYLTTDEATKYVQDSSGNHVFRVASSGTADAAITWTTAMTILNNGNVGIGTTTPDNKFYVLADSGDWVGKFFSKGTGAQNLIAFNLSAGGAAVGSITTNGTSVSYNTSSDYRLKENVLPMSGSIDRLKALKPSKFNFIADPLTTVDGFIAHEVGGVVPECVRGTKDAMMDEEYEVTPALGEVFIPSFEGVTDNNGNTPVNPEQVISSSVEKPDLLNDDEQWREVTPVVMGTRSVPDYQGIDQSKLVPLLVASLQEAIARIEVLENA